jgi:DNA polymerase III subunit delta
MARASVEQLVERLAKGKPISGVLLLGPDAFLRDLCRKKIIEAYVEDASREWAVIRFSAPEDPADAVIGQAQMLPMLAKRQVVVWSGVESLEKLGEASRDAALVRLEAYLKNPAPFSVLVLEADSLDERMRVFKVLSSGLLAVECDLPGDPEERSMPAAAMAIEMAREAGVELSQDAANCLVEMTNASLARMQTELEKLKTFAGERSAITRGDVELLVVSDQRFSVWQLSNMLAAGDRVHAMEFLESLLREGEQPVAIIGAIAWMFRKLVEIKDLPRGTTVWDVAKLGMRRDTADLALASAAKIGRGQLVKGLRALADADNRLKLGSADKRAVMEFLIAQLVAPAESAASAHAVP